MARLNAPRNAGNHSPSRHGVPSQDNKPEPTARGWPFAEGSQNHLDEISAPWPRPSSRTAPTKPPAKDTPPQ